MIRFHAPSRLRCKHPMKNPVTPIFMYTLAALASTSAVAVEKAVYDSAGKLTALLHDGAAMEVRAGFQVTFEGGVVVAMQPHDQRSPITRDGINLSWKGTTTFPNSGSADFAVGWTESDEVAVHGSLSHAGRWPLLVESAEYVIDVPREAFVGGSLTSGEKIPLKHEKPADAVLLNGEPTRLEFTDASENWRLALILDQPRRVTVTDHWDGQGRSYRVRIVLHSGAWPTDLKPELGVRLALTGRATAAAARLSVDATKPLYPFDGFGGNYCWGTESPVTEYALENLKIAWSRHELKAILWDAQRGNPGPAFDEEFKRIQRVQRAGIPWIISAWRLPERFYVDPNQKPFGTFGRQVAADRWDELLELFGSYLLHLKEHYDAEPDMFSFNEPDLGVNVGFSAEAHREMTKRIGAHLKKLGLKTRMLLGDTANPRDTHKYVLPTAADAEAMRYVAAVSFHSWGNGSPAQYQAWADVARWLQVPLLVGEAGVDPGSYRNANYDSYAYSLREADQYQDLLRHARPQSLLYWQFTGDYALARVDPDGKVVPGGRFWLMQQFCNLTPMKSSVVASSSDQSGVPISAFARGAELVVHILNTGPARSAAITGLPAGVWRRFTTTETAGLQETSTASAPATLDLPARSFTTLVRGPQ